MTHAQPNTRPHAPMRPPAEHPCYLAPYAEVVDRAGACFEALLWRSRETQGARFEVIAECADLTGRVVADMGCGRADLAAWLAARGIQYGRYLGVDGVPEMVRFARDRAAREGLAECGFIAADFAADLRVFDRLATDHHADCMIFSGSLNTLDPALAARVLGAAWTAVARRGGLLIFNFLSDRDGGPPASEIDKGPARRFDTLRMVRWALERTSNIVLRHDYLDGQDATIAMRPARP